MADDAAPYPLLAFRYAVNVKGADAGFSEVTGLTLEYEIVRYRHGFSKQLGEQKMPGRPKVTEVTLKKGIFASDNAFYEWIMTNHNKLERQNVVIKLLDETFSPKMTWTLLKAWPSKIEGPSFKGDGNEVAVESLTLAYEEMKIDKV